MEKKPTYQETDKELVVEDLVEPLIHFVSGILTKQSNFDRDFNANDKQYDFLNDFHISNGSVKAMEVLKNGKAKIEKIKLEKKDNKLVKIEIHFDTEDSGYNITIIKLMNKALEDFLRKNNLEKN